MSENALKLSENNFRKKSGGGYFITRDKPLLARSGVIASIIEIDVVTPAVFLERVAEAGQRAVKFGKR